MSRLSPVSQRELIRKLRLFGREGPSAGAKHAKMRRGDAMRNQLQQDGTRIMGTILNDWNPKASPGGYYGYQGGYYKSYKGY